MRLLLLILLLIPINSQALGVGETISTVVITESNGNSATDYPLTIGHPFKAGDVASGTYIGVKIGTTIYMAQCDVKNTWPDGSIKFAVISSVIPITANAETVVTLYVSSTTSTTGEMTEADYLNESIETEIRLTNIVSNNYNGSLTGDLNALIDAGSFSYWLKGAVVSEILLSETLNNSLEGKYEVRCYPNSSFGCRVTAGVENVWIEYRGDIGYDLDIQAGTPTLTSRYSNTGMTHYHDTRWKQTFWLGSEPPDVDIRINIEYWANSGVIPPLDSSVTISSTTVTSQYLAWTNADTDINGKGVITYKDMGATGGRPELGLLQRWDAIYLLTGDSDIRKVVVESADLAGQIPVHLRESDSTYTVGNVVSIDDRPDIDYMANTGMPFAIDTIDNNGWHIDRSHVAPFAFIAYTITGDNWYREEVMFWGAETLIHDDYRRKGVGSISGYDFSSSIGDGTAANGVIYAQERGVAWGLRSLVYASFCADGDEKAYFKDKLDNNIQWLSLANSGGNQHSLGIPMWTRVTLETSNTDYYSFAPWQADFLMLSLGMAKTLGVSSNYTAELSSILSLFGSWRIGTLVNSPSYNPYWATGYVFPMFLASESFATEKSWSDYKAMNEDCGSSTLTVGATAFPSSYISDGLSYLYIAHASVQMFYSVDGYADANQIIVDDYNATERATEPQWAFAPINYTGTTPSIGSPLGGNSSLGNIGTGNSSINFN